MKETATIRNKMQKLQRDLEYYSRQYYVYDRSEISDYEYDAMFRELQELEAAYPAFADPNSPTRRVGGEALTKFAPAEHHVPLGSLTDVFSYDELFDFIRKADGEVGNAAYFSAAPKIDGL